MKHFYFSATVFAITLQVTTVATAADTPPTVSAFDGCVAGRLALSSGGMTAQAAAYKACREQYPVTPEENEAILKLQRKISAGSSPGASGTSGTTSSGASSTTASSATSSISSGTTPASSPSPASTPAASPPPSVPASTPSASPGASGGNPHGGAPGQSKK
jgi:hypothetical protein